MGRRGRLTAAVLVGLVACMGPRVWAEATAEEGAEPEYAYGTVAEIAPDHLIVKEYNYDTGAIVDVSYAVDPQVQLDNVDAVTAIAPGDEVDLDYVMKDGARVATFITVQKPTPGESADQVPEGAVDESPEPPGR
jgi:hypothetical protein